MRVSRMFTLRSFTNKMSRLFCRAARASARAAGSTLSTSFLNTMLPMRTTLPVIGCGNARLVIVATCPPTSPTAEFFLDAGATNLN